MIKQHEDYRWSGYRHHGCAEDLTYLSDHPCYERLGASLQERAVAYRGACAEMLDAAELEAILQAVNQSLVLGVERFKDQIEATLRRRARPGMGGRPHKKRGAVAEGSQCEFNV